MDFLHPLKYGLKVANRLLARPGQLVYCREQTSITACFYELLGGQGIDLSDEETNYVDSLNTKPTGSLGRPCIILDRMPDSLFSVCFISQIKGKNFSPIGQFFGVPIAGKTRNVPHPLVHQKSALPPNFAQKSPPFYLAHESSTSFIPLRLTDPTGDDVRSGRFYLFAIPVTRRWIYMPPGDHRYLVDEDLGKAVELARQRVAACGKIHSTLRKDQLDWVKATPRWRFKNPQERGVDVRTYLRL
ncbi:hypothetical protein K438DRAFT_1062956 [Mycena galopus ATCC 62051]|nr:hypothetical protein K438DRAFT_1062956 [Mycena galopus ATCC 62051]